MTTFLHVTLEVKASGLAKFIETMGEATSLLEGWGWKLHGAFVQRTGKHQQKGDMFVNFPMSRERLPNNEVAMLFREMGSSRALKTA